MIIGVDFPTVVSKASEQGLVVIVLTILFFLTDSILDDLSRARTSL